MSPSLECVAVATSTDPSHQGRLSGRTFHYLDVSMRSPTCHSAPSDLLVSRER